MFLYHCYDDFVISLFFMIFEYHILLDFDDFIINFYKIIINYSFNFVINLLLVINIFFSLAILIVNRLYYSFILYVLQNVFMLLLKICQ